MSAIYQPQEIQPAKTDYQVIADLLRKRVTRRSGLSMLDFAQTCKITAGPRKGEILKLENAPYSRRPLELMGPDHITQLVVLMWASQSMKSINGQVVSAYYIQELPSEVLYAMADLAGMRKTMNRRIVPMLEGLGVEFVTSTETKNSRRTGDTTFSKEGNGFNFDGITANSSAALASETKRLFIADELGNWKVEIGNQGNPFYQGWARLKAWLDEKKCLVPSTPGDEGSCMVEHLFETGTQEEWLVHCPLCGSPQILEVRNKDGYGLNWQVRKGRIIEKSVTYTCLKCAESFSEKHKFAIQQDGFWEQPEDVEPINRYTASFHLHSINSMFESWLEIASAYEKGLEDPIARKYYDNHVAGSPHKQSTTKLKASEVMQKRGDYRRQTVPDGVLFLTLGGDVQRGAERWEEYEPDKLQIEIDKAKKDGDIYTKSFPRIEIEIFGSGPAYRGWSIDYQVFYGKVDNAYFGAFELLYEYIEKTMEKNGGFGFKREKDDRLFPVVRLHIDSGYNAPIVYEFTQRLLDTYPVKGDRIVTPSKNQKNNDLHASNFIRWKKSNASGTILYTLSTKLYKYMLQKFLKVPRVDEEIQLPNFQDFPRTEGIDDPHYGSRFFEMLTASELRKDGEYDKKGRPNESEANRTYAMNAADVYIHDLVEQWKAHYKAEKKWSEQQIENINSRWVVELLAKDAGIDKRFLITKSGK